MSHNLSPHPISRPLLFILAALTVSGSFALLISNIWGSMVVPGHDWVSDTVSDLAAGRYEIIQDVGLYAYAGALVAVALAAAHLHRGAWTWTAMSLLSVVLALCVTVIGARNEYGDGDNAGIVIHIYVVYAMGAAYVAFFVAAGLAFAPITQRLSWLSWGCAAIWGLGAPVFFIMPTAYDGAWERALGLVSVVWTLGFARYLLALSRGKAA